jgi:hypothetical protein
VQFELPPACLAIGNRGYDCQARLRGLVESAEADLARVGAVSNCRLRARRLEVAGNGCEARLRGLVESTQADLARVGAV